MHIKAVAFDLDGTLLTSDKHVAPSSIKAISRLRDMGILPVVATGRNVALARHLIIQAGIPTPLINCNGACIYDWDHDTDLLHITLNEKASLAALEFARQSSCHLHVFMDHEIYFEEDGKYVISRPISTEIESRIFDIFQPSAFYKGHVHREDGRDIAREKIIRAAFR